jgi:hypothetical protein
VAAIAGYGRGFSAALLFAATSYGGGTRVTIIAADVILRTVVADQQPVSAMTTAQEAGEQSLSRTHRAAGHHAAVGIVGDQPLVPFMVRPRQISLMMGWIAAK